MNRIEMKKISSIIFILIGMVTSVYAQHGKIAISPQIVYENSNSYFPHDHFIQDSNEGIACSIKIEKKDNLFQIENTFDDGFKGHSILIQFNSDYEIVSGTYEEWTGFDENSETRYELENIILTTNQTPNESIDLVGHYTLLIKSSSNNGNDDSQYRTFNGKFKFYSQSEKQMEKASILNQHEVDEGIKDSDGVYIYPDEDPSFNGGYKELEKYLRKYNVKRSETRISLDGFVSVRIIVNENGIVDPKSLSIPEGMRSTRLLNLMKEDVHLLTNWIPAKHNGENVKSEVNLSIRVYE